MSQVAETAILVMCCVLNVDVTRVYCLAYVVFWMSTVYCLAMCCVLNVDQLFFDNSFLPDVWRQTYIAPVFKKGEATQAN